MPADELGFSATNLDSLGRLLSKHVTYWLITNRQIKTKDFDLRAVMMSMVPVVRVIWNAKRMKKFEID